MSRAANCILALLVATAAQAAEIPKITNGKSEVRLWVDQIGYRTGARKIVVVASDKAIPSTLDLELCDASTFDPVWRLKDQPESLKPFNAGQKDKDSGDFIAHLDLSAFKKPGRYFLALKNGTAAERSCAFNIGDGIYTASGLSAWKALYYQRADTEKTEKHAGPWTHKLSHRGPGQAAEAKVTKWGGGKHWDPVGKEILDPTPRDVTGGWWDAGDFNKYMGNTTNAHNTLLLGVQLLGDSIKDNDLNIPESGNGVPDLLDEIRYCTEFLLRMADETGAAFGKVHELGACPPESNTTPVQLTQQTSGATMNRLCALAYAAVVWKERKLDDAFAQKCLDAARKAWKLLEEKPHPWPPDPKDPKKMAYTGEWYVADFGHCRTLAAACLYRLTGDAKYHEIFKSAASKWTTWFAGEGGELWPSIFVYLGTPNADADLAQKLKQHVIDSAEHVVKLSGFARGYASGVKGYWWGSNAMVSRTGMNAILAAELTGDANARSRYVEAAEDYVHYLFGRNALGLCFLTNLKKFGAENSVMIMFHSWMGKDGDKNSARYIGEGEGKIGPFPGMVVGGVNGGMKRYTQSLHWTQNPWEFNEPCLGYQAPCACLMAYFALKVR